MIKIEDEILIKRLEESLEAIRSAEEAHEHSGKVLYRNKQSFWKLIFSHYPKCQTISFPPDFDGWYVEERKEKETLSTEDKVTLDSSHPSERMWR